MVYVHEYPPQPVASVAEPPRTPLRLFGWCLARVWLIVALGGAVCGALAVNVLSLLFFPITAAIGFALGASYGLPVIVSLAWWLSRQRPGPDPRRFVRTLQIIGASIALAVNGTTNFWFVTGMVSPFPSGAPIDPWATLGWLVLASAFTAASGLVGWTFGATLAQRYLVAIDHAAGPGRQVARRRRPWR